MSMTDCCASILRSTDYIFENNREWVAKCLSKDRDTFNRLSKSQKPRYMYIGCSDSRVPAQNMMVSDRVNMMVNERVNMMVSERVNMMVSERVKLMVSGRANESE